MDAKRYNNIKITVGIIKTILTFIFLFLFIALNYSKELTVYIDGFTTNPYLLLIIYVICIGISFSLIFFPINFYTEFILEHKYKLSNQTFWTWIWENLKGTLVGGVIGLPLLMLFYFVLESFGEIWWLPFAIIMFIVSVVLSKFVPIVILPLFYKTSPIEDDDLKKRIFRLSENVNLTVENIFKFDMSKNTKKANAAFTGLGKTKKILLGDTLMEEFTNDEIETVIAHELGHYKHKHILINMAISTFTSFLTLYLLSILYQVSLNSFGFTHITEIAALPILSLWGMILGLIQTPVTNIISRRHEYQADEYAVNSTNKKEIFIDTLTKLNKKNLGDDDPHPFIEWFFYSHPSIKKRIAHINNI